jgi:hypothetical protein
MGYVSSLIIIPLLALISFSYSYSFSISYVLSIEDMAFKCKTCGLQFEEKRRLEIHKQVHGRKSKVTEYGSPEFSQDRLRG